MNSSEQRLIAIFKLFVKKAILPHLRTNEPALKEWFRFSSLLGSTNYGILQQFVEAIPSPSGQIEPKKEEIRINVLLAPSSFQEVDRSKQMFSEIETRRELIAGRQLMNKLKEENIKARASSVNTNPIQYEGLSSKGLGGDKADPLGRRMEFQRGKSAGKIQEVSRNLQRLLNKMQQNQSKIEDFFDIPR